MHLWNIHRKSQTQPPVTTPAISEMTSGILHVSDHRRHSKAELAKAIQTVMVHSPSPPLQKKTLHNPLSSLRNTRKRVSNFAFAPAYIALFHPSDLLTAIMHEPLKADIDAIFLSLLRKLFSLVASP